MNVLDSDKLKKQLKSLAKEKGIHNVIRELVIERISPSLASMLAHGTYGSELKSTSIEKINKVLARCS